LEKQLGFTFPDDYKQFIAVYGSGRFADFVGFPHPFHPSSDSSRFLRFAKQRLEGIAFTKRETPRHATLFPTWPESGGLFPFGYTDNGGTICWLTDGIPEQWPVVLFPDSYYGDYELIRLPVSQLLSGWLSHRLSIRSLTPPDLFPVLKPVFVPDNG